MAELTRLISGALCSASDAVSDLAGCPIEISGTLLSLMSPDGLPYITLYPENPVVASYVGFTGDVPGHALFMLDEKVADRIVERALLGMPDDPEMATSLLCEMGNLACSALVNTVADTSGLCITPLPPTVVRDMKGALLESVASALLATSDEILLVRTAMKAFGANEEGYLLYIPETESLAKILNLVEVR